MIEQVAIEKRKDWECFKHNLECTFRVHRKILSPPYWNNDDYDVFTALYNLDTDFDNETIYNFEKLKKELNARRFSEESVEFTEDSIINTLMRLQEYGDIECCSDSNEINLRIQLMK